METELIDLLKDPTLISKLPLSPEDLLRWLIATTDLKLSYPGDAELVRKALQDPSFTRHFESVNVNADGIVMSIRKKHFKSKSHFDSEGPPSIKRQKLEDPTHLRNSLYRRTAYQRLLNEAFIDNSQPFVEVCGFITRTECDRRREKQVVLEDDLKRHCQKVHFEPTIRNQTEPHLGHCSYLNTCHRPETCRYLHFTLEDPGSKRYIGQSTDKAKPLNGLTVQVLPGYRGFPAQWLECDLRNFDTTILPSFHVVLLDPPWDIHQSLPYGTMTDDEMRALPIPALQEDGGILFMWVTGRAMELGRECLALWGYQRIDEIVWVKTSQVQSLIRTGRTGHWLNHSKEHCLVAYKKSRNPENQSVAKALAGFNRGLDTDVIVAEVRETSRKPDELYELVERVCPGGRKIGRKIELFGRMHNTRPGWLTIGNQLGDTNQIFDEEIIQKFNQRYPERAIAKAFLK